MRWPFFSAAAWSAPTRAGDRPARDGLSLLSQSSAHRFPSLMVDSCPAPRKVMIGQGTEQEGSLPSGGMRR